MPINDACQPYWAKVVFQPLGKLRLNNRARIMAIVQKALCVLGMLVFAKRPVALSRLSMLCLCLSFALMIVQMELDNP